MAGAILITDGEVHDAPPANQMTLKAPLQVLIAGKRGERDRKLTIVNAARFAIVGQTAEMTLRVDDFGADDGGIADVQDLGGRQAARHPQRAGGARLRPSRCRSRMKAKILSSWRPSPARPN